MHDGSKDCMNNCYEHFDDDHLSGLRDLSADMRKRFIEQVIEDKRMETGSSSRVMVEVCLFEWSEISECWDCLVQDHGPPDGDLGKWGNGGDGICREHDKEEEGALISEVNWTEYLMTGSLLFGLGVDWFEEDGTK